jgi:hypothetical protein
MQNPERGFSPGQADVTKRKDSRNGMEIRDSAPEVPIKNQFILTPLFLNDPLPGLETLAKPDWIINRPSVPNAAKPRMQVTDPSWRFSQASP